MENAAETIKAFHDRLISELMENEELIATLRSSYPNADSLLNGI
jgi:hypothetical protein